jgi:hypothetical protein
VLGCKPSSINLPKVVPYGKKKSFDPPRRDRVATGPSDLGSVCRDGQAQDVSDYCLSVARVVTDPSVVEDFPQKGMHLDMKEQDQSLPVSDDSTHCPECGRTRSAFGSRGLLKLDGRRRCSVCGQSKEVPWSDIPDVDAPEDPPDEVPAKDRRCTLYNDPKAIQALLIWYP